MDLFPAIDIRGGRCVRLHQGDYARETVYDADPVAVARAFDDAGASWIHVVDLDAARTGEQTSRALIGEIASAVTAKVETGGGVRTERDVDELIGLGLARVVLGTAAMADPSIVGRAADRHPGAVAVGLDTKHGEVAVRGWTEGTGEQAVDVLARFEDMGVAAFVVTEISRDATMEGPDVDAYERLLASTSIPVVASGGVGTLEHLRDLNRLPLEGVIVGKALYEHRFTVADALAVLR
ncbi:MAG: phosphoribosylformimino-5-aminoimidazole carboxamide ribotide isomerase [Actinomycetota bacterium]|nr:phosphoribosylformimino-5-aminoimidazole carboxamide ribotide isomerase [Actinomycetota bacterium]